MHILSKIEEKELFDSRLKTLKKKTRLFLNEQKGDEKSFLPLFRLFLLADNYGAEDLIPYDEIKREINSPIKLMQVVRSFREKIRVYDKDIQRIVSKGMEIRKGYQPEYPAFFCSQERIYLKIDEASSGKLYIDEIICGINVFLPKDEQLNVVENTSSILVQSQKDQKCKNHLLGTKAGRFLKKQAQYVGQLLNRITLSDYTDEFVRFLNSVHNYDGYFKGYSKFKLVSSFKFPRALLTPVLFYSIKNDGKILGQEDFKNRLEKIYHFYLKHYQNFHTMQAIHSGNKQQDNTINMLLLSKNPYDIAKMSAYTEYAKNEWGSCLSPHGINSYYLPDEVGKGVFVVYGVNSKNPAKKLSRISVKPYINEKGDTYFGIGYMYGLRLPKVKEALETFLAPYQPKLNGAFSLKKGLYKDATPDTYYFNMDELDILKSQQLDYYECVAGRMGVGNYQRKKMPIIFETDFSCLIDNRPKVQVSANGVDKDVTFSNMDIFGVFECYYLTKARADLLPYHTDELRLISSNLQNIKGIDARYFTLDMHLSDKLKSLDGLSTYCSDVSLTRMNFNVPFFKIPQQVCNLKCAITTFNVEHLDLANVSHSLQIGESDLSGVKKITFPQCIDKVDIVFSKMPKKIKLDINKIKRFSFMPLNKVMIESFNASDNLKHLQLMNVNFCELDVLDLSHLTSVSLSYTSLEKVSKLILPEDETKVSIGRSCKLPYGMTPEMVIKNKGYGFRVGENKVTPRKINSREITPFVVKNQIPNSNGRCC